MTPAGRPHSFGAHRPKATYTEAILTPPSRHPPEYISHRGAHDALPENSLPAFLRAFELGADAIELDVHATRDGVVVVHHDPLLNAGRMPTGKKLAIADLSASEVNQFDLGGGVRVPTLQEVLHAVPAAGRVYVEIKGRNIEPLVVRVIRESSGNCAVHSFDHRIVQTVKEIFPAIRTGVLEVARHVDPAAVLSETSAQDLWQETGFIDEDLVTRVHAANGRVVAWTANDPTTWKTLNAIGVDAICTDRIGELAAFDW